MCEYNHLFRLWVSRSIGLWPLLIVVQPDWVQASTCIHAFSRSSRLVKASVSEVGVFPLPPCLLLQGIKIPRPVRNKLTFTLPQNPDVCRR